MILRFHLIPVKMAIIKNTTANADKDVGKRNISTLLVEMYISATAMESNMEVLHETTSRTTT
jgi:hypothetical protein